MRRLVCTVVGLEGLLREGLFGFREVVGGAGGGGVMFMCFLCRRGGGGAVDGMVCVGKVVGG